MEEKAVLSTNNESDLNQSIVILKENSIPYIVKTEGAGDYFRVAMGNSLGNISTIYVSEEDYEKAKELLEVPEQEDLSDTIPDELKEENEEPEIDKYKNKTRFIGWLVIGIPLCICTLIWIILMINYFG